MRSTAPVRAANHRRVLAALTGVLLAGPQAAERLRASKRAIDANGHRLLVIAMVSTGAQASGTFAGLFAVGAEGAEAASVGGGGRKAWQQQQQSRGPGQPWQWGLWPWRQR